jgi:hypothetical protein
VVTSVALLCASLAWAGWVYLHTVGDVHRAEKVATAVLEDPDSSRQLSTAITDQLMTALSLEPTQRPLLRGAVEDALSDPAVSTQVIAAFGAAHANAVGVDDPRPTTINGAALVQAVRANLTVVAPEVAAVIPDGLVGEVTLPKVHPPGVAALRTAAEKATLWLALGAVALIAVALVLGERRRTVRRVGIWGISSGLIWMVIPFLVPLAAKAWAPSVSAIVDVAMKESAAAVLPAAIALVAGGAIAVVVSFIPSLFPDDAGSSVVRTSTRATYSSAGAGMVTSSGARQVPTATTTHVAPARMPTDTFVPSHEPTAIMHGTATHPPAASTQPPRDPLFPPAQQQTPVLPPAAAEPEFDPWAHYGPDQSNRPS